MQIYERRCSKLRTTRAKTLRWEPVRCALRISRRLVWMARGGKHWR